MRCEHTEKMPQLTPSAELKLIPGTVGLAENQTPSMKRFWSFWRTSRAYDWVNIQPDQVTAAAIPRTVDGKTIAV